MWEAGLERSHEDIQKTDINDALTPNRADRCKVGTELIAGKTVDQQAQEHGRNGCVPGGLWEVERFYGQLGAQNMERSPKPLMSAKLG